MQCLTKFSILHTTARARKNARHTNTHSRLFIVNARLPNLIALPSFKKLSKIYKKENMHCMVAILLSNKITLRLVVYAVKNVLKPFFPFFFFFIRAFLIVSCALVKVKILYMEKFYAFVSKILLYMVLFYFIMLVQTCMMELKETLKEEKRADTLLKLCTQNE